jgi:hypothetical protein
MSGRDLEGAGDASTASSIGAPPLRPFGWAWAWRTLWLRKWQLLAVFGLTITVYGAGLVLPICTQRAVDLIAAGNAGLPLVGLGIGAIVAIAAEAVLMSTREKVVISLLAFLERRISRRAFLHLMRRRIDLGVTQGVAALDVLLRRPDRVRGAGCRVAIGLRHAQPACPGPRAGRAEFQGHRPAARRAIRKA